ncbi:MAG: O-antigen ligase family protein [Candidatus Kerfeldbacteria bacterium]|nr:O-antigen ligase family protein [Candidatus Kerfeldbacteria bacterium]
MIITALTFLILTAPLLIIPLTWWAIEYGLAAVILLLPTYLLRSTILGIPTTNLELAIYGLVLGAILHWTLRGSWPRLQIPRLGRWFLGGWCVAWILATVFSTDRSASLGALKAWLVDPLLFGFILLATVTTVKRLRLLLHAVASSGTIVAIAGLIQLVAYHETLQDGRLSSFFAPVANYAAMFLAPMLILTVGALLWKHLNRWWWLGAMVMFVALTLTVSFGGYVSLGVGLLVLWWRWPDRRQRRLALIAAIIIAAVGLAALSQTPYLAEKFNTRDRSSSLVRTQIWRTSVEMIRDHPLVGIGPNAYEPIYRATIPRLYWPPLEWLVAQPHQLYLALWLETGLLGLIVFLGGTMWWFKHLAGPWRRGESLVILAVATYLGVLVHGFVDTPLFKNDLAIILVLIVCLPFLKIGSVDKKIHPA